VEEKEGQQDEREKPKPRGLFSGLFKRRRTVITPKKQLGAHEWFEKGLLILRTTGDRVRAARAFALSIRLNPRYQEAYLHRGLVYEALGNLQQAIEDYGMAVSLDPKEGKAHNVRGLVLEHPGVTVKAIAGLRRAADLQRAPAQTLLRSPAELREAWEAFTERHRDEGKVGDTGTGGPLEAAENLQRLIEKYKKEIPQLEAQLQELNRKHVILLEAARLLQEEVLAPHRSQYEELSGMHTKKGSHCSQP
jgi:tetratricopeptide (TPR) repeat protein